MKIRKRALLTAAMMLLMTGMAGCGNTQTSDPAGEVAEQSAASEITLNDKQFVITLYPEYAPLSCENFENLVKEGFYDGIIFHRVIEGFMAQGGDPTGTGMGGSEKNVKGEFKSNGVDNTLSHTRGIVSMARANDPDSGSSQFFICYDDCSSWLDGDYAAFGEVTEGMEVVDDFLKVEREMSGNGELSVPKTPITMDKVEMYTPDSEGHDRVLVTMKDFLPKN